MHGAIFTRNDAPENRDKLRLMDFTLTVERMLSEMEPEARERAYATLQRMQEQQRAFFDQLAPDVVVVAEFSPGFSPDLSSWRLTLNLAGLLVQEDDIKNFNDHSNDGPLRDVVEVGTEFVVSVLARADELDFWNLTIDSGLLGTDAPSLCLSIRNGNRRRQWAPHLVYWHAHESIEGAVKFMELWNLVHQHAPFPPKD